MSRVGVVCTFVIAAVLFVTPAAAQEPPLTIVNTGPHGPLDRLEQANEIRIVFSEPMVTLGRIPNPVTAPFVRITPAIAGTLPLVGHDHPDLHAGSEAAAPVRHDVRR